MYSMISIAEVTGLRGGTKQIWNFNYLWSERRKSGRKWGESGAKVVRKWGESGPKVNEIQMAKGETKVRKSGRKWGESMLIYFRLSHLAWGRKAKGERRKWAKGESQVRKWEH